MTEANAAAEVLSKDEVESLMENNQQNNPYDFSEPLISQIEHGQTFRILDTLFIDELTTSLAQFMHVPVQISDAGIEISRYDKVVAQIKNKPRSYHAVKLMPDNENCLISLSQALIYHSVELLFGGHPERQYSGEKPLSPIELNIANKITQTILQSLMNAWESVASKQIDVEAVSHHPLRIPICNSAEKVVVINYNITLRGNQVEFIFCLPIKLFDFKTQKESDKEKMNDPEHLAWARELKDNVLNSKINLSTVLTETQIKLNRIQNLKVGDIVPIARPKEGKLIAEGLPIFTGECGTQGEHNVIKLKQCLFD